MRTVFFLFLISLLLSCDFNQSKNKETNPLAITDSVVDIEKLSGMKLTNPDQYRQVIDRLDQGDLASIDMAKILFENSASDTLTRDSMFVVFNDFFNLVAAGYLNNNEVINAQLENSPSTEVVNKLKTRFYAYGILVGSSEGNFYLDPQNDYLLQNFGSKLSSGYRDYLTILSKEQKMRFAEDGEILIPVDSLISRIITWENFMSRYPAFISVKMAQDKYAQYMSAFLAGMDNSRVFDRSTNHLSDSVKVSFESFLVKYPNSKSSELVEDYLELLKSINFNYSERVDSFLLEKVYH
ncbi:MAG: hypothetical protein WCL21_07050 [Mariniphaga sp.]